MSSPQLCCQYFLNHDLELSQIELQVKDLIKAGYQCIYAHARLGLFTPYFGRHWWDAIRLIASLCAEHGVGFGIWDEDNYPSPVAGNRLVWDRPELVARHLQFTVAEEQLQAGQQYRLELKPEALLGAFALDEKNRLFDLSEFCGTAATRWQERHLNYTAYTNLAKMPAHHWRAKCNDRRYYLQWQAPEEGRYRFAALQVHHAFDRLHNSDLMNPETIRLFLESTHLRYKQELGEELFNQTVVASFMDEPAVSGFFPWTGNFAAEFASEHGYDLLEQLAHLVWNIDDSSFIVRRDYRMTIHRLLCQNYLAQTQEYCHKLNIQSIGHLTRMEYLSFVDKVWPNQLRACRYLDIPCADPLGAIVALPDSCGNHCALKVAVSAKRIFGKKHAGSDCLAVIGNHTPLRDLKYIFDYHLVMGITFFNVHGLSYSLDGARKDEVPPSLFYQHSQWSEMPALLSEIKQKIELLSGGEDLREIAVLYPSSSLFAAVTAIDAKVNHPLEEITHRLVEALLAKQKDFDFVDEVTLLELDFNYKTLILNELDYINQSTADKIGELAASGVDIIALKKIPRLLGDRQNPLREWKQAPVSLQESLDFTRLPGPKLLGKGSQDIFLLQKHKEGKQIDFLFNRAQHEFEGSLDGLPLRIGARNSLLLIDKQGEMCLPEFAEALPLNQWELNFPSNHSALPMWQCGGRSYNLLQRQAPPQEVLRGADNEVYCHFTFEGELPANLRLSLDGAAAQKTEAIFLNGHQLPALERRRFIDCHDMSVNIAEFVRSGSSPSQNELRLKVSEFSEMPYIIGNFSTQFRYEPNSTLWLSGNKGNFSLSHLQAWSTLGYANYSGMASYSCEIDCSECREYLLDLGRVEDLAKVYVDEVLCQTLLAEPYRLSLGNLAAGKHRLRIEVYNSPANRDRLAAKPAGLLGPVRLK